MFKIKKDLLDSIKKYASQETVHHWNACVSKLNSDRKIKVANTGLVSSGKSSLFNVLLGNFDSENPRFAVGAARTTRAQDIESLNDMIELADTPGIDVNDEDNQTALDSMLQTDIIIMIHNIKMGALNSSEYNWLSSISHRMNNDDERKARLIFVCNWIDERDSSEDYQHTVDETHKMVEEAVECNIEFYETSVKRYLTGVQKNKQGLINRSNINIVRNAIIEKAKQYSAVSEKIVADEFISLCDEIISEMKNKRNTYNDSIQSIISEIKEKYDCLRSRWKSAISIFRGQYNIVENKENELHSI